MKYPLNIAFFGTSNRSVPILNALHNNFNLKLCITKTDRKVGRKQTLEATKVKEWALEHKIDFLEIQSTKGPEQEKILSKLKECKIDLGVVADFSYMIPKSIINEPRLKLINVHFSLLPKYRGACPVQFAIMNGDTKTGVTYFVMNEGMDTGDILQTVPYQLTGHETSAELFEMLFELAADNISNTITGYSEGKLAPHAQDHNQATYTYSKTNPSKTFIFKEDAQIDWKQPHSTIYNQIRAFFPWPISWTYLEELENLGINIKDGKNGNLKVKVISAELKDNRLIPLQVQVEGSKAVSWKDFLNGYCA